LFEVMDRAVATSSTAHSLTVARIEGRAPPGGGGSRADLGGGPVVGCRARPAEVDDPAGAACLRGTDGLLFLTQQVQQQPAALQ
jgi:hypothetical protein